MACKSDPLIKKKQMEPPTPMLTHCGTPWHDSSWFDTLVGHSDLTRALDTLTCDTLTWHAFLHFCGTFLLDTLVGHGGTLWLDTRSRHSLWDTLTKVGHSYLILRDNLTWHFCRALWLDTLSWHSCRALLLDTFVRHSYFTLLWDALLWHACSTLLRGHSCRALLFYTLARHSHLTLL